MSAFPQAGLIGYWPLGTLPEKPDNATGAAYSSNFATTDGWDENGNTLSIVDGNMRCAYGTGNTIFKDIGVSPNAKHWRAKARASATLNLSLVYSDGSAYVALKTISVGTSWIIVEAYLPSGAADNKIHIYSDGGSGTYFELNFVYIGNTAYDSKESDVFGVLDLTSQGVTPVIGLSGNALLFDGVFSQCFCSLATHPAEFTISAWIKTPGLSTGMTHAGIFDLEYDASVYLDDDGRVVFATLTPENILTQPSGNLFDDAWHFIEAVYDGTTKTIRVDGVVVASVASAFSYAYSSHLLVGYHSHDIDHSRFNGIIDEVRFYDRANTDAQGLIAYQAITPQECPYLGSSLLEDTSYLASWTETFTFTYLAGTTLSLTATLLGTIPLGTEVRIYAGETLATLELVESGVKTELLFLSTASGPTTLYIRLVLCTSTRWLNPIASSLSLLVHQETSLYTIATQILADGLTPSNTSWNVDRELQKYPIPYAWFDPVKHRFAIGKVAEAAGGVVYQDRYGVIQVEAGNFLTRDPSAPSLFTILANRVYDASSPVSTIRNRIQIRTNPYVALAETTVWTLTGDTKIDAGESRSFDVFYSDYDAVINGHTVLSSTPAGASITSETHYSWGATIVVLGSANDQELSLVVHGQPLAIQGSQLVERTDGASIRKNGDRAFTIDGNNMIQSEALAAIIADDILAITKDGSRDIEIDWRGDPTIELGDLGTVLGFRTAVITQEIIFDGILRGVAQVRKVN